jgi:putative addiction module CopG family antidote
MAMSIPDDLTPFVEGVIASGRCQNEDEVILEALRVFRDVERKRQRLRDEIIAGMESGEPIPADIVFEELEAYARQLDEQS